MKLSSYSYSYSYSDLFFSLTAPISPERSVLFPISPRLVGAMCQFPFSFPKTECKTETKIKTKTKTKTKIKIKTKTKTGTKTKTKNKPKLTSLAARIPLSSEQ